MLSRPFVPAAVPDRSPGGSSAGRSRVRVAVFVLVGVVAAALAGCTTTATAKPTPAPTSSHSPAPSATPSPTPSPTSTPLPARPAAMDAVNVDGAIAAATYFMELYPYAYNTGDSTELKELSHPECIFCKSVTDETEQMHARGEHQEGSATRVVSARGTEVNPGYWYAVDASVEQDGWRLLDAGGNVIGGEPTVTKIYAMTFAIVHQDGRWFVRGAEFTVE
ncbi:MAG: DUF6318 family protein [Cellulomonas sp.]